MVEACRCFDIDPPESLQKVAIGAMGLISGALIAPSAISSAKSNLKAVEGQNVIMTPEQMTARRAQMGV